MISTEKKKNTYKTKNNKKNKVLIINTMWKIIKNLVIKNRVFFTFFYKILLFTGQKYLISKESTCALQGY